MDRRLRHLPLLRCFEAAARHQSYSLAADELSITQAAVSQQIRNLEQHLAVKLFMREGRGMLLTKQGKVFAESVQKAFIELSHGFDRIQLEGEAGVLTVTATPSFCSRWLMPRLWKFSQQYPTIQVRAIASTQYEDVRHSEIDVAIRQGEVNHQKVHQEVLLRDPLFPVCSPRVMAEIPLSSPEQVKQCWLVEAIGSGATGLTWHDWFTLANVPLQQQQMKWTEVTTWEMGINAVMSGHGVFLTSACMVQDLLESGRLVKPFDIQIEPGLVFSMLYDHESPRLARISLFTDWLKQEINEGEALSLR
ncbi:LysR substrate-binding domain-containing protein [Paraglaciecola aquimarina]|uniref:LysR substrate-binding domain-containing protein n=1 Tax=Paraglaciecola aquimarina TaxID=1235557 RepID=A0ABU3SWS8_9ALTE|nr:LysR substrate-binding domain-containing protein [Paraglaciecola aquimarina]MDU0354461.1 LysR substrate-binding domain-containing protein [Paraglaciecola aquimarina]